MGRRHSPTGRTDQAQRRRAPRNRVAATGGATFPVVAIGASAGGLEAFRTLLAALPAQSGMAFILVQHLDPTHASMLVELLSPHTAMTVLEAREDMRIEPDHIYVIPPGRYVTVHNGALHLSRPREPLGVRMPFDVLLQSLADEVGERAICIVLSGTATDGSVGTRAVNGVGGLVIAQDPAEAEYDGMPRSAIATGAVDLVLTLAKVPEALASYAGHRYLKTGNGGAALPLGNGLTKIIDLLRKRTSHDFALYKEGTLGRRIERRMAMAGIEDSERYLELLIQDPAELQHLADDLFINVTRFFRDADAFGLLAEKIVPELVRARPPGRPIRVWVAGCSTGEEAYSIAMLFLEEIAAAQRNVKLQIFASDVDADAVASAREGLFLPSIEADVSPARLARFFTKEDRGYRVSRELRAAVIFSVHDLVADAPFSRLDFISCRNLLIYLRPEVQQKVLSLFHFALREGGFLFLGASETAGGASDHFEPISKRRRVYRHIGSSRPGDVELPLGRGESGRSLWVRPTRQAATARNVSELAQRLLLESYAPASVLVNHKHQGLYYFGPTDLYLKMPAGVANLDLLAAAREGLRPAIRTAFEKASQGQERAVAVAGRVKRNGRSIAVSVTAQPVKSDGGELVLLSFRDVPPRGQTTEALIEPPADASRIAQVEQELDATRKELEDAVHDREAAEEEVRTINEEAMSVNEEFQTTNEELETSKEELQSLNEELTALNGQLQETLDQHQAMANDLENILNSSDLATVFLGEDLKIRFFTPAAKALFSVIASDIGRPLADLAHHFADGDLLAEAQTVLSTLVSTTREIEAENGAWYTCRILPYRTKDNRIKGVVMTFVDVTARKQAEDALTAAKLRAESANLGKSRFLAAASHDLRQPLQTLNLLQGLLSKKIKDADALQLVALSEEALTAMSGMLNTLLDINQLEAGVIRPEVVEFPISYLLDRLRAEFTYHTQTHGLGWRVLPCRLAVRSDPRLLEQMIRNLLSNAVKYTKQGRILLGCRRRGDKLSIEVWDTGLGIPEGQLRAIFEEFHQIDNPARELSRGLGLGLAIVQRLGDLLGHAVDVRSRQGMGSAFTIEVALAPEGAPLAPNGGEREPALVASRTGSILIVEDDPALRGALELLLRSEGHRTAAAADGEAAIALVARKDVQPDLVVVDYNLPRGLTGLQVMARLRDMLGHDVPALILTGDISTETLREIAGQGHVQRSKPASAEELTRLIRKLLAEKRSASPQKGAS
jgi:two-component system, chemotaxis family, CheB/CheR fusion protein